MINAWQVQSSILALIVCVGLWPSPFDLHAQTAFRAEIEGTHLPTYGNAYESLPAGKPG